MTLPLSIILVLVCSISFFSAKHNLLLFLFVLSEFADIFDFNIGVSLKMHHLIVIMYIPRLISYYSNSLFLKKKLKPLVLEYIWVIILGVIFGFMFPFDDPYGSLRLFAQRSEMRTIISSIRLMIELFSILLIIYWINTNKISFEFIIKAISIVLILNVSIAILDFFNSSIIRFTICPAAMLNPGYDRFSGLCGEPRAFGRYCSLGFIFLLYFTSVYYNKLRSIAIFTSSIGIILSLSASSIAITIIGLIFYIISHRQIKYLAAIFPLIILGYGFLNSNLIFQEVTLTKINNVLGIEESGNSLEKVSDDEPAFFARFEIFDRAALNFFYKNPQYILSGVGPNLISIPASPYLTNSNKSVFGDTINSTPHTMLINVLSRTGIVGLILFTLFFFNIYNSIKFRNNKFFFLSYFLMSILVFTSLFYFFCGISIVLIQNTYNKNQQIL